jgi:hypothetical protein
MMDNNYRPRRKTTVQLTSLLDLLFVMIFVSLLQNNIPKGVETKKTAPPKVTIKKKTKAKPKIIKKIAKPVTIPKIVPITAKFNFYAIAENPTLSEGTYQMQGNFNRKTGKLSLGGVSWINRPKGYDMVPLSGFIDLKSNTFKGRIEFQGCEIFTLTRDRKSGSAPLGGTWRGKYKCIQGQTGLTLTIN